jgi:hypothetical protein
MQIPCYICENCGLKKRPASEFEVDEDERANYSFLQLASDDVEDQLLPDDVVEESDRVSEPGTTILAYKLFFHVGHRISYIDAVINNIAGDDSEDNFRMEDLEQNNLEDIHEYCGT